VTILVDECRWPWRGRQWCHLVSDTSFTELHEFARRLGVPRIAFQGDHYDLHERGRSVAIALGAQPVDSRVIVRALDAAGLRRGPAFARSGVSGVQHIEVPPIETERLILRQWRPDDLDAIAAINADPAVMAHLGGPLDRAASAQRLDLDAVSIARRGFGKWAVTRRDTGELIGRVGFDGVDWDMPFAPAVELGWRIAVRHQGRGFAAEAARATARLGFGAFELDELVAYTTTLNTASRAVMHRIGMTHDEVDDFDHPHLDVGDPRRRHVLMRLRSSVG
jgi:RimJ/RimL family protein N-acetyltransferase